jgi:hypothetical protein
MSIDTNNFAAKKAVLDFEEELQSKFLQIMTQQMVPWNHAPKN